MMKKILVLLLTLSIAGFAFAKGGPVQPNPADVSYGSTAPMTHPWATDLVSWSVAASLTQYHYRAANGTIGDWFYVFGEQNNPYANAYNYITNTWSPSTPPILGNCNWCGVPTDDALYIVGRYSGSYGNEVQKFVPTGGGPTGTWSLVAPYPVAGCGIAAAWDGGDFIYAAGGNPSLTAAYKYSISANTWTPIASIPAIRSYCGGWYAGGKFLVYGGTQVGLENTLIVYDPGTNTWSNGANLPVAVWFSTFSTTGHSLLMFSVGGGGGYGTWPATDAVQIYDPATNTWSLETSLPVAHGLNAAGYTQSGEVCSAGGYLETYDCFYGTGFQPAADENAPAAVSSFNVAHNNLLLTATLTWTNPSTNVGGGTLTDLDGVKIYRDNVLIDNVTDVVIGAPYSYDNNVPALGMYSYRVVPYNDYGDGLPASQSAWIGLDVPGAPHNVVAALADDDVQVTWVAPIEGGHQGYWPANNWNGQKVYRNGAEVADLTGTNTSYTDTPPYVGTFTYSVSYYNNSGEGPQGFATPLYVPGPPQFTVSEIPYNWVEINGVGHNTGIAGDDVNAGPFPIGFDFPFYSGTLFNSIRVCSNGFASFTSTVTSFTNYAIPTAAEPNNLLAVFWDDMNLSTAGVAYYYYDAPNSRFIVEWDHVPHYSTGGSYTFEIILYESGMIDYMYMELTPGTALSATVGIENAAGDEGIQCTYNGSGPYEPTPRYGLRFAPPMEYDVEIVLTPYSTPIQIPANGGTFEFNVELTNNETSPTNFSAWTMATLPNGSDYGPILNVNVTLGAGVSVDRDRIQNVPGNAPAGNYVYHGYVGIYPGMIWNEDSFAFEKLAVDDGGAFVTDWYNWGEDFGGPTAELISAAPEEFALHSAYPNPFNPTTTIAYDLKEAANVKLVVFDITGREVATLVDGWMTEGGHYALFNAQNLASGVYFYTIKAGNFTDTKKMILMK